MEVDKKNNIRVTCIQPGAVTTELYGRTSDTAHRQMLEDFGKQTTMLKASDIADAVVFEVQAPGHVNVATLFVLPTEEV